MADLLFEHDTCSRCGGTGHYSYNQMTGTRCFKCNGKGQTLTKRGDAAQTFLNGLRTKLYKDVQVGDTVYVNGIGGFSAGSWLVITSVKEEGEHIMLQGEGHGLGGYLNSTLRIKETPEQHTANIAAALAYQERLTKAGKERK